MTITMPTAFEVLERAGLGAFLRQKVIGAEEEWLVCVDNDMHLWAYVCKTLICNVVPRTNSGYAYGGGGSTNVATVIEEESTSDVDHIIAPYALGSERYGKTNSAIYWEALHAAGTITATAENHARSTTYDTDTDTNAASSLYTGTLDISGSGAEGLFCVAFRATSGPGTPHEVSLVWAQVVEVALTDFG